MRKILAFIAFLISPDSAAPEEKFGGLRDVVNTLRVGGIAGLLALFIGHLPEWATMFLPQLGTILEYVATQIPDTATGAAYISAIVGIVLAAINLWKQGRDPAKLKPETRIGR